jgi:K+-sensing histidine kinase KdpD
MVSEGTVSSPSSNSYHGPSWELEPLASNSSGLGLGLYITREIVRAHGGRIDVLSDEASGTTFVVTLPRAPVRPSWSEAHR